jgi:hypothetical protein
MRLAASRLTQAEPAAPPRAPARGLPPEVERALQVLEGIPPERMGDAAAEVLRRLEPLLRAAAASKPLRRAK